MRMKIKSLLDCTDNESNTYPKIVMNILMIVKINDDKIAIKIFMKMKITLRVMMTFNNNGNNNNNYDDIYNGI